MDQQPVDSSTYEKDVSANEDSPQSDLERESSMSERMTPTAPPNILNHYPNIGGLATAPFINNPFQLTSSPFSSAAVTATFNPMNLLQTANNGFSLPCNGLDPLAMATAFQSASLSNYPSTENVLSSSMPWNKYLSQITNRKRRQIKVESSASPTQESTVKKPKNAQNQPSSTSSSNNNNERKDDGYWDRRRKNNEAAKRSRDAKRLKEVHTAKKAEYLERENVELKAQINLLKSESANLQFLLFNNKMAANSSVANVNTSSPSMTNLMKRAVEVSRAL